MGDSLKSLSDLLGKEEEGVKVASWGDLFMKTENLCGSAGERVE